MGEGFGDYLAASFFAESKRDAPRYRNTVMSWDGILYPGRPPAVRRVDRRWTYADFIVGDDEHENGEIWSAVLWDVWNALGRTRADKIIIESHFQQNAHTDFARGARAILDANRNIYGGWRQEKLRQIFRRRGIHQIH